MEREEVARTGSARDRAREKRDREERGEHDRQRAPDAVESPRPSPGIWRAVDPRAACGAGVGPPPRAADRNAESGEQR